MEMKELIPPLKPRHLDVKYCANVDRLDKVAQSEIPLDGPVNRRAVATIGDGNCLCRAVSKGNYNDDCHHIEIRVWIVLEGVLNHEKYLTDSYRERGASFVHQNADLPTVFATFSEFYTPGQKTN